MRHGRLALVGVAVLAIVYAVTRKPEPAAESAAPARADTADCKGLVHKGKRYTHCVAVPGRHRIGTRLSGRDGLPYRGFARLAAEVDVGTIAFAMNGGMFGTDGRPIGYYVEQGERLQTLNRRLASGNFYLKPNGVFFGKADGGWRVMTSEAFAGQVTTRPEFGTQSGPMLLIGGRLHPAISPTGTSLKLRNAVGVDASGRAHFVISEEPVSFGELAAMLRDHAGTPDALFLDGTVSALWLPAAGRMDGGVPLGPLVVISRR